MNSKCLSTRQQSQYVIWFFDWLNVFQAPTFLVCALNYSLKVWNAIPNPRAWKERVGSALGDRFQAKRFRDAVV